jgi:hypothetical protein
MRTLRVVCLAASLTLLIAGFGACSANGGRSVEVDNPSTPASKKTLPPTVKLTIKPTSLLVGQTATVTWVTTNATSCTAVGAWGGMIPTQSGVPVTLGPVTTPGVYTYGANCVGPGGSGTASVIVTVGEVAAPTIQFAITPDTIAPGGSALITWSTTNATGCTGTSGEGNYNWEGVQPTQNSAGFDTNVISTVGQYAYNLTCLGPGGSGGGADGDLCGDAHGGATGPGNLVLLDHDGCHGVQRQRRQRHRRVARRSAGEQRRHQQRRDRHRGHLFVYVDVYRRGRQHCAERRCGGECRVHRAGRERGHVHLARANRGG